jgi:hypothetical protein
MIKPFSRCGSKLPRLGNRGSIRLRTPLAQRPGMERGVSGDDYYAEIAIEIDGWLWNVTDRAMARFPRAHKLLAEWSEEARRKVRRLL